MQLIKLELKRALLTGIEPVTFWLTARRSTNWAIGEYTVFRGAIRFIHILQHRTILKLHTTCTEIWLLPDLNLAFRSWKDRVITFRLRSRKTIWQDSNRYLPCVGAIPLSYKSSRCKSYAANTWLISATADHENLAMETPPTGADPAISAVTGRRLCCLSSEAHWLFTYTIRLIFWKPRQFL